MSIPILKEPFTTSINSCLASRSSLEKELRLDNWSDMSTPRSKESFTVSTNSNAASTSSVPVARRASVIIASLASRRGPPF